MITAFSLILVLMLSIGGSPAGSFNPAGGPGDTGIQAPVVNNLNTNRFFEDYTQKTASRLFHKKIPEIVLIDQPKTQIRLMFTLPLKEKPLLMGYEDSMNLYQAFNMNPINFTDPFGKQHQVTVTPEGAEFERPMTVGEFWESLMEAGVSEDEALNIIAENTYYSKYFWDGSLVDRIKTHQMDLTLTDSESRALGMEYNVTLKGPREQFGRLFRGEFKEFGKAALENLDRQFGDPENVALMFSGGIKIKGAKPYPILNKRGILQWKDPLTGRFVKAPLKGFSKMWGPQSGLGPLGKDVAKTFRSSTYYEIILEEDLILYRVYGGKSGELGSYWTKTRPSGPLQSQLDSAILPEWGNTLQNVVKIRVPKGTKIYEGIAASQKGVKQPFVNLPGGGNQVFIPRVYPKWIIK